ncbi:MAG: tripartite tricarboxylate transporter substrate binding protein [Pigmentiphaga sp.]|nr:tripartite tricarboxylate transporter substrate binding protein [Pigmentiphaga sp.]
MPPFTTHPIVRPVLLVMALFAGMAATPASAASSWPDKPIKLVVPYPPGGGTDIVARLLATEMQKSLGQGVVVENRPGGSTVIGTAHVAQADPDGYTIGLITDSHAINPHTVEKLPYDSEKDFVPISQLVSVPFVMVTSRKIDVKSVQELVTKAKAAPGTINYASIGNATPHSLAMEWFKDMARIDMVHIPYTGVAPALNDIVGNQVDVMFTGTSSGLPHARNGNLDAIAVSSAERAAVAPDIPTIAESGYPDFEFMTWYGLVAPAGTPDAVVQKLSEAVHEGMRQPAVTERLASLGVDVATSTPSEFAATIRQATDRYAKLTKLTSQR